MPLLEMTQPETRGPNSVVTGAGAKRAILQNYNSLALMRVSEALNMNLSAEFHAEK